MCLWGEKNMTIEGFYYDEKENMLDMIHREMEECRQKMTYEECRIEYEQSTEKINMIKSCVETPDREWNPEEDSRFLMYVERVVSFAEEAGLNIKIQTHEDGSAVFRIQTEDIWILGEGETSRKQKEMLQDLLEKAVYIHMGNREHNGKNLIEMEFEIKFNLPELS